MDFLAHVFVQLKPEVNDPQGSTVLSALSSLGFSSVKNVRVGKFMEISLQATDKESASSQVQEMGQRLLANPTIESFEVRVQ